jgi:hypothetical protein
LSRCSRAAPVVGSQIYLPGAEADARPAALEIARVERDRIERLITDATGQAVHGRPDSAARPRAARSPERLTPRLFE